MPPSKTRIGPVYVDVDIAQALEEAWRTTVDAANRNGRTIPKFGQFVAEILRAWVTEQRNHMIK